MILVTQKDGTLVALNVDRLERVERNAVSGGRESNVFFVGGGHLVVEESQDELLAWILDAKARVLARALAIARLSDAPAWRWQDTLDEERPAGSPSLRMVPNPDTGR